MVCGDVAELTEQGALRLSMLLEATVTNITQGWNPDGVSGDEVLVLHEGVNRISFERTDGADEGSDVVRRLARLTARPQVKRGRPDRARYSRWSRRAT